jgi:hypothetical protein
MTTDVATYNPDGGTQAIIAAGQIGQFQEFAKTVAVSALMSDGLRGKPADILVAVLQGIDLGLRPMQAIGLIDVIKGKPSLSAEGKRALVVAAGHGFRVDEWTDEKCVVSGCRRGTDEWRTASFTIAQAKKAGLAGDNWNKYPADMLLARATSRLCKAYFADVTNGLATTEELLDVPAAPTRPTLAQVAAQRTDRPTVIEADSPTDEELRAAVLNLAADQAEPADLFPGPAA